MDRRFLLVALVISWSHWGWSMEIFGGLTELINYKSTLPCVADENQNCFAANGIMGMTLDKASQAGLNISSIILQNENEVYVTSKDHGTCLVDTKNSNYKDKVLFICSSEKTDSLKSKKVERVFSLQKNLNNDFLLTEIKKTKDIRKTLLKMIIHSLKEKGPSILVGISVLTALLGLILNTPFTNIIFSASMLLLFFAWLTANFLKYINLENSHEKMRIKKTMIAMSLCISLGVLMLAYYEYQIPKYSVAKIKKELYRVPPQLSKKQLIELGRECNTYGNTLCSHDVFARVVKMDPRDYTSLANLAMAQSHLGFHQYAIINFDRAIQNGAKTFDIFKFYGNSLLNLDKKELAIQSYRKSLKLNPNQPSLKKKIDSLEQPLNTEI